MAQDIDLQNICGKFISDLMATLRRAILYPAQHPAVVFSIQAAYTALQEALNIKDTISLSLSPDNKILLDAKPFSDKKVTQVLDLVPYFKQFEIDTLIFSSGIELKELEGFIFSLSQEADLTKQIGDINKVFESKGIGHIKAEQFSYIKIKKDQEALVVEQEGQPSTIELLRSKIQDYVQGKISNKEDVGAIEKEIFDQISDEFKEDKKLSTPLKNILKKFLLYQKEIETVLNKLKQVLVSQGYDIQLVDDLIGKVRKEVQKKPIARPSSALTQEGAEPKQETQVLQGKIAQLEQELAQKTALLEEYEKESNLVCEEKQRIENIVRNMADGLVVVDPQGKVLMVNAAGEQLLGITKDDIGKPLKDVVKDEHLLALVKGSAIAQEDFIEKDIELISNNESTKKVVRASSAVVQDPSGKPVGMVTVLNDITKQRELDRVKANFVANVSHELRTPLVAMQKSITLILEKTTGPLTGEQEQFLSIAERNVQRLSLLINDLLDLSKLEAGKMELKRQVTPIENVIGDSVATLNSWALTKSLSLEKKIEKGLPQINIDSNRIIQVLNNLIGNAVKFSPPNSTITVEAILTADSGGVQISVKDQGIGIDKENLGKIFSKFYQVGEKVPSGIGGTGIGLSIAKEIVQLHAGKIWVESEKGQGAKFSFTLPLTP